MKRLILFLMLSVFLSACNKNQVSDNQYMDKKIEKDESPYANIELKKEAYSLELESEVGIYTKDVIPDKETAIAVAIEIFNSMEKSSYAEKYEPQMVSYDEYEGIWIVSFWETQNPEEEMVTIGNDCSIAIRKKDGQILRIWFGE